MKQPGKTFISILLGSILLFSASCAVRRPLACPNPDRNHKVKLTYHRPRLNLVVSRRDHINVNLLLNSQKREEMVETLLSNLQTENIGIPNIDTYKMKSISNNTMVASLNNNIDLPVKKIKPWTENNISDGGKIENKMTINTKLESKRKIDSLRKQVKPKTKGQKMADNALILTLIEPSILVTTFELGLISPGLAVIIILGFILSLAGLVTAIKAKRIIKQEGGKGIREARAAMILGLIMIGIPIAYAFLTILLLILFSSSAYI